MKLASVNAKAQKYGFVVTKCYMRVGEKQCRYAVRRKNEFTKIYPVKNLEEAMRYIQAQQLQWVQDSLDSANAVQNTAKRMFKYFGLDFSTVEDQFTNLLIAISDSSPQQ
jgi:hypothetical protein